MNRLKPHLALLLGNAIWALDFPFYNLVLPRYVHPIALVSASLIVTALISLVPLLWERAEKVDLADIRQLFAAALLMGVMRKTFLMFGLARTSPIDGSIIDTVVPLLVLVLSVMLGIDRFSRLKIAGLILGMAGAIAVVVTGASDGHARSQLGGNLLILLCAAVSAVYMVRFKRLVAKYRVTTLLRWIYCMAAVIMLPFGLKEIVRTDYALIGSDPRIVLAVLFVVIMPTYFPNLLLNYALKWVQPTVTSLYTYLQPVLAIAVSVAMGLDRLHADTLLFAAVIFVGVGMVLRSYRSHPAPPTPAGH